MVQEMSITQLASYTRDLLDVRAKLVTELEAIDKRAKEIDEEIRDHAFGLEGDLHKVLFHALLLRGTPHMDAFITAGKMARAILDGLTL